jgi:hypothetical protein
MAPITSVQYVKSLSDSHQLTKCNMAPDILPENNASPFVRLLRVATKISPRFIGAPHKPRQKLVSVSEPADGADNNQKEDAPPCL